MLKEPFFLVGLVRPVRVLMLLGWVILGLLVVSVFYPLFSEAQRNRVMCAWAKGLLITMGVRLQVEGCVSASGILMVSNHVSWLDPFLLLAVYPVRFVAKAEIRDWPVIGWLAARVGTIFIRRDRQRDVTQVAHYFAEHLGLGQGVAWFPESTTSYGTHVKHFKTGLFQVAVSQRVPCVPVALRYTGSLAIWVDDMGLFESAWRILAQAHTDARLYICPAIAANQGLGRRELARASEQAIASVLSLPVRRSQPEKDVDLPAGLR
jgi:1-acyl-sn-glycerol-3-phosphate acyltransferase